MTAGQGFIAVALVYFSAWGRPRVGARFSLVNALQLQVDCRHRHSRQYASMAPYVLTIIALVFASRRIDQPAASQAVRTGR